MGSDDTKTGRSGKVKFFKVDTSGDIHAAVPKKRHEEPQKLSGTGTDLHPVEQTSKFILERDEAQDGFITKQLGRLKSKLDDISKIPTEENLSKGQVDTLKKYIELRDLEARDLRDQLRQYQEYLKKVSTQFEEAIKMNRELIDKNDSLKRDRDRLQGELAGFEDKLRDQVAGVRSEYEQRVSASGGIQNEIKDLRHEKEEWKEKVRSDLKRIKLKEKELENKYELLKRDAQALLDSKDKHVLELKKKGDQLEMDLESAEEKLRGSAMILGAIDSKKRRLVETMKLAITLLEDIDRDPSKEHSGDQTKKKTG